MSVYDMATTSPKKVSVYLGRLTQGAGLIPKGMQDARLPRPPPIIQECGNAALPTTGQRSGTCSRPSSGPLGCLPRLLAGTHRPDHHLDRRVHATLLGRGHLGET